MDADKEIMMLRERVATLEAQQKKEHEEYSELKTKVEGLMKFRWTVMGGAVIASVLAGQFGQGFAELVRAAGS